MNKHHALRFEKKPDSQRFDLTIHAANKWTLSFDLGPKGENSIYQDATIAVCQLDTHYRKCSVEVVREVQTYKGVSHCTAV